MNNDPIDPNARELPPGDQLGPADRDRLWCVRRGVLGIVHRTPDGDDRVHYLALPGDLVGAEALAGAAWPARVFAVTAADLGAVVGSEAALHHDLLALAYAQARRQGRDMVHLRSGSLTERLRHLLLLLGDADADEADLVLPSLRQLADIVDASPEAVCRVLGSLRQLDVLKAGEPGRTRVANRALRQFVVPPGMSSGLPGPRLRQPSTT